MVVCVCSESPSNNQVAVSTTHCSCQWLVVLNRLRRSLVAPCVCVGGGGGGGDFYLIPPLVCSHSFPFAPWGVVIASPLLCVT